LIPAQPASAYSPYRHLRHRSNPFRKAELALEGDLNRVLSRIIRIGRIRFPQLVSEADFLLDGQDRLEWLDEMDRFDFVHISTVVVVLIAIALLEVLSGLLDQVLLFQSLVAKHYQIRQKRLGRNAPLCPRIHPSSVHVVANGRPQVCDVL